MPVEGPKASENHSPVLLIEVESYTRLQHEVALREAGYHVRVFSACPGPVDLSYARLVVADASTFEMLHSHPSGRLPPVVVLSDDERAGVTACLQGAAAWAPAHGQPAYLVDTVGGVLHAGHSRR